MKHTFSADEEALATPEGALEALAGAVTRNQRLVLKRAIDAWFEIRGEASSYPDALYVAAQLKAMRADTSILVAALFGTDVSARHYPEEYVREHFGQECASFVSGVRWLNELTINDSSSSASSDTRDQAESLRRMVLSLVEDIRVVLVKLAYRTQRLYKLVKHDHPQRIALAEETLAIYAPLANRLGLGQLKWELEDVAFRIVNPDAYKHIARSLEENRAARESYIHEFVASLDQHLVEGGVQGAEVLGRPKHIHSIWKKMRAKHIEFADLFDVRAVRVLVDNVQQCYGALGVAHGCWQPIAREFDDYIANPKDNGYRSLHTAVIGPAGKPVEIQIRTRAMDNDAENGVAAHWAYKEGSPVDEALQKNINALRQLLEDNDDEQLVEGFNQQIDAERVLERELKRLKVNSVSIDKLVRRLKFDKPEQLFVAIGRNDVSIAQIAGAIEQLSEPVAGLPVVAAPALLDNAGGRRQSHARRSQSRSGDDGVRVRGVGTGNQHLVRYRGANSGYAPHCAGCQHG